MSVAILTTIDPNDNAQARYQYMVSGWLLLRRRLPPAEVSDRWPDDAIDEPWWEPVLELPPGGEIRRHWEQQTSREVDAHEYAWQARQVAGHVVAYAPSGREVRRERDSDQLVVQPHNDNYWIRVPDLRSAREAYYHPSQWRR